MSQKTWGGRFEGGTDARVEAFTESITFDRRLFRHDIRASRAHAAMLAAVGLITASEAEAIRAALDEQGHVGLVDALYVVPVPVAYSGVSAPTSFALPYDLLLTDISSPPSSHPPQCHSCPCPSSSPPSP